MNDVDYWNSRAEDIYLKYRNVTDDFNDLIAALNIIKPESVLDYGCGAGRLFPIFKAYSAKITGLDISKIALQKARVNHPDCDYIYGDFRQLISNFDMFDLIICNRVLSAIQPLQITRCLKKLMKVGRVIYLNEYKGNKITQYWHSHNYDRILGKSIKLPEGSKLYIINDEN